jgi:hypothetical protein
MKARRKQRKLRQSDLQIDRTPFFTTGREKTGNLFFQHTNAQAKLSVNAPADSYEKQADQVASQIVRGEAVQRQEELRVRRQEEEEMQTKLQRQSEEEEMQTKLQKQEEEEEVQTKLQKQEEEEVQAKIQRQAEEEETIQTKAIQSKEDSLTTTVESRINAQKGGGVALPDALRHDLEEKMHASFRHVRIHNDNISDKLCRDINARAFTVGNDIFFRTDEYQPNTTTGLELLAHELTHVIQQRKGI